MSEVTQHEAKFKPTRQAAPGDREQSINQMAFDLHTATLAEKQMPAEPRPCALCMRLAAYLYDCGWGKRA